MRTIRHGSRLALAVILSATSSSCGGDDGTSQLDFAAAIPPPPPLETSSPAGRLPASFEVSGDGAATLRVPIEVPIGRAGMAPELALMYSSRSGNGLAGVGWGVSGFSQISRCGNTSFYDGETRPVQFGTHDRFCLDGQRLIQVSPVGAQPTTAQCAGTTNVEYRTQPETFRRIIACDRDDFGPISWLVYDKTGRISYYGTSVNSRIEVDVPKNDGNGGDGATVKRRPTWLLSRVEDRYQNDMKLTYGRGTVAGTIEWWPLRIDYTGGPTRASTLQVRFQYRDDGAPADPQRFDRWSTYSAGIEYTHDRLLKRILVGRLKTDNTLELARSYRLTYPTAVIPPPGTLAQRSLLTEIRVCDGADVCLDPTKFSYASSTPTFTESSKLAISDLATPYLQGTDVNGDGKDDLLYSTSANGLTFESTRFAGGTMEAPVFLPPVTTRISADLTGRTPYDTTMDGAVDLVASGCTLRPQFPNECQQFGAVTLRVTANGDLEKAFEETTCTDPTSSTCMFGVDGVTDLDGDHTHDLVYGALVSLGGGPGVQQLASTIARSNATSGSPRYIDIDGDGAVDRLVPHSSPNRYDAWHVRGQPALWENETTPLALPTKNGNCQLYADVNGDGLADMIDVQTGAQVMLNRGDGRFVAASNWATDFKGTSLCVDRVSPSFPSRGWKQTAIYPVDYNHDGMQDLLVLQPVSDPNDPAAATQASVLVSSGHGFTKIKLPGIPLDKDTDNNGTRDCTRLDQTSAAAVLDMNGDGRFDVVFECVTATSRYLRIYSQDVQAAAVETPDTLREIEDGLGAKRKLTYGVMTDPAVHKSQRTWHQPLLAVVSEAITDGSGSFIEIARHEYEGGTASSTAEGFLGFRRHTVTDPRNGGKHRITYATDDLPRSITGHLGGREFHPFAGHVLEDLTYAVTGTTTVATRATRVPQLKVETFPGSNAKSYFVFDEQVTAETYDAATFDPDAPPGSLTRTVTTMTPNACGDPTNVTVDRDPGAAIPVMDITARTYDPAPPTGVCDLGANWVGVMKSEKVDSSGKDAEERPLTQSRETLFVGATDATGKLTGVIRDIERQPTLTADNQAQCTRFYRDSSGLPTTVDVYPGRCGAMPNGVPAPGANTRRTITAYDPEGIHVTSVEQLVDPSAPSKNHLTSQQVHWGLGVIQTSTDANTISVVRTFDGFGRLVREDNPDGSSRQAAYLRPAAAAASPCLTDGFTTTSFGMVERMTGSGGRETFRCLDRLGQPRRVATRISAAALAYVDTTYGSASRAASERYPERVYRVTRPHAANALGSALVAQSAEYDAMGRVTKSCTADPTPTGGAACTTTTYSGLSTTTADQVEAGVVQVKRKQVTSRFGTVESTSIFPDGTTEVPTTFTYGPFDTLVRVKDLNDNKVKQTFDALGRRTRIVDPDAGTTDTTYTAFDEVDSLTDARLITTRMAYDRLGRIRTRTVPGDPAFDEVFWDDPGHKGRIAKTVRGSVTRVFQYTTPGQLKTSTLTVDGASYAEDVEYDTLGRVTSSTVPEIIGLGRVKIVPTYTGPSRVTHLDLVRTSATCTATSQCHTGETCTANLCTRDLWTETEIDAEGRSKGEWLGKNPSTQVGVLARSTGFTGGYVTTITTQRDATTLQDDAYAYQKNGNLKSRQNKLQTGALETFAYDGADRLHTATIGSTTQTWNYDALGNLTYASDARLISSCVKGADFEYTKSTPWGPVGPHAVSRVTCRELPSLTAPFHYDAAGNDLYGLNAGDEFRWTSFGKIAQTTGKVDTWQFTYDADHSRVMKVQTNSILNPHPYYPWKKIVFAGPLERRFKPGGEQHILSIPVPSSSATFQLIWDWNGTAGTPTALFTHPDRLGSPELVTNAGTGAIVEQRSFDAWGNARGSNMVEAGPWPSTTTIAFTGHHDDLGVMIGDGWGFIDMGGRIYNPLLKRFWSPDPFVQAPMDGPSWNRYSYVFNNPLKFTDPTGYRTIENFFDSGRDGGWGADNFSIGPDEFVSGWLERRSKHFRRPTTTITTDGRLQVPEGAILLYEIASAGWGSLVASADQDDPVEQCKRDPEPCTRIIYESRPLEGCWWDGPGGCSRHWAAENARRQHLELERRVEILKRFAKDAEWLIVNVPLPPPFGRMRDTAFNIAAASEDPHGLAAGLTKRYFSSLIKLIADQQAIDDDGNLICPYCGVTMTTAPGYPHSRQHDHIVAHANGGSNDLDNCAACCASCNQSKGKKDVWTWLVSSITKHYGD